MAIIKVTVKTPTKTYVSASVDAPGNTNEDYGLIAALNALKMENFPAFTGTLAEWEAAVDNSIEVKIEKLGPSV